MKIFRRFLSINQIFQGFSVFIFYSRKHYFLDGNSYLEDDFDCVHSFQIWFHSDIILFFLLKAFDIVEETNIILNVFLDQFYKKTKIIINNETSKQKNENKFNCETLSLANITNEYYYLQNSLPLTTFIFHQRAVIISTRFSIIKLKLNY